MLVTALVSDQMRQQCRQNLVFNKMHAFFIENYIMIVGDGKRVHFFAPNISDPLPACLEGTKNRVPAPSGIRRNPSMMKTHGN